MESDHEIEEEAMSMEESMEARFQGVRDFLIISLEKALTTIASLDQRMRSMEERFEIAEKRLEDLSKTWTDKMKMETVFEAPSTSTPKGGAEPQPLETPPPPKKLKTSKGVKIPVNLQDLTPVLADRIRRANVKLNRDAKSKLTYAQNAYIAHWFKEKTEDGVVVTGKTSDVLLLSADAIRDGIWYAGWQPVGIKRSLEHYLCEKLKGHNKRESERRREKDNMISDLSTILQQGVAEDVEREGLVGVEGEERG